MAAAAPRMSLKELVEQKGIGVRTARYTLFRMIGEFEERIVE